MNKKGDILLHYVQPILHRQGIGRLLLHSIESHALQVELATLQTESTITALEFYNSAGFEKNSGAIYEDGLKVTIPLIKYMI